MTLPNGNGIKTINKVLGWVLGLGVTLVVLFLSLLISKLDTLSSRIMTNDIALSGIREQVNQLQALSHETHQAHVVTEVRWHEVQGRLTTLEERVKTLSEK
jgi:Na+-transporting methylmalonyl-CoA/oxaloacetate decarboxylase gamma subunit